MKGQIQIPIHHMDGTSMQTFNFLLFSMRLFPNILLYYNRD